MHDATELLRQIDCLENQILVNEAAHALMDKKDPRRRGHRREVSRMQRKLMDLQNDYWKWCAAKNTDALQCLETFNTALKRSGLEVAR